MKKIKKVILGLIIGSLTLSFNSSTYAIAKETDESNCPIIIIPGIMGTHLYADEEGKERIWEP